MCKKCPKNSQKTASTASETAVLNLSLDKLAQLGKKVFQDPIDESKIKGFTSINDIETLKERSKRTYQKTWLSMGLVQLTQAKKELALDELKRQTSRKRTPTNRKFKNKDHYSLNNSKQIRDFPLYSAYPSPQKKENNTLSILGSALCLFNKAIKQLDNEQKIGFLLYSWTSRLKTKNYTKPPLKKYGFANFPLNQKKIPAFFIHKKRGSGKTIETFDSQNEEIKILRSYQNMYHCNRELVVQSNGKVTANYCKNRLCMVCNSIRTAELMNKYEPVFEAWKDDMYLVTLTAVNCPKDHLVKQSVEMFDIFTKVKDVFKKRHKAGKKEPKCKYTEKSKRWKKYLRWQDYPKFEGIRKFECTSTRPNDYHPHFHIIVKGEKSANDLMDQWLKIANKSKILTRNKDNETANIDGQDVVKADKDSSKELFKYFTKIYSSSDTDEEKSIYLERLDTIFRAMRKKRVFQNFGFFLKDYVQGEAAPADKIEVDLDLMIELGANDAQQDRVNEIYQIFIHHTDRKGAAILQLQEDLYTLEVEHSLNFKGYLSEKDLQLQKLAYKAFENTEKTRKDIEDLHLILVSIEIQEQKYRAKPYGEAVTDEEIPDRIYLFNDKKGMWYCRNDGSPLFEYKLSTKIKEIVKRFKLPKGYSSKIFELFIRQKQNSLIK